MDIPTLKELLEEKTTLILGAGASFDYGFPLWSGLKSQLLQLLENSEQYGIESTDAVEWWIDRLRKMSKDETIDKVATDAPEEYYDLFRKLISIAIIEYEKLDLSESKTGWIEQFAKKFAKILIDLYPDSRAIQAVIENFNIITLNYDRVFDIRFKAIVEEEFSKVLTKKREFQKFYKNIFSRLGTIYHPHGSLGPTNGVSISCYTYMNPNSVYGFPYGNIDVLLKELQRGEIPYVLPVDDLVDADNITYNHANTILQHTSNVICIGLSPLGLNLSNLDLTHVKSVYYSGEEKIENNFIPLNIYAEELIDLL